MDEKTIRIMKRLYNVIPDHLRAGWKFDASNISTFGGGEYGIISGSPRCCLGISVDVRSSLRTNWYDYDGKGRDNKTGAAMAAWVAAANPENVKELLDKVDHLRSELAKANEIIEILGDALADIVENTTDESSHDTALAALKG